MAAPLKKLWFAITLPLKLVLGVLLVGIYNIFSGWWRDKKSSAENLRERFASEIQEKVPCLFSHYGARIVPNTEEYPAAFDYTAVTLNVEVMLLRFIRGRGDFRVDVTPSYQPTAWREISAVVKGSALADETGRKIDYYGLHDFSRFFQSNCDVVTNEVRKTDWRAPRVKLVPI